MQCNCATSNFKDSHHNHVVTGDLSIIENADLRGLLQKGLNYRDQAAPNKPKALRAVKEALNTYIKKKSSTNHLPEQAFLEWKDGILTTVQNKLDHYSPFSFNNILSKPSVKEELQRLQDIYTFVPTDKAANNVSIVCKKFYVQLLHQEISSGTYELSSETEAEILARHNQFLQSHGIKVKADHQKLPYMYATVKMHKNPVKFRFITPNRDTSLQQLSVAVGVCLQSGLKIVKNNSKYLNNI